ncbi:hypothetical protein ACIBI3_05630 [Actinomadura luteofluorescens]|uniref:hypothetical protein n=1 Tax=Actinomadura luteofluorescens TaxID=46163 RepID=UPI0034776AC1
MIFTLTGAMLMGLAAAFMTKKQKLAIAAICLSIFILAMYAKFLAVVFSALVGVAAGWAIRGLGHLIVKLAAKNRLVAAIVGFVQKHPIVTFVLAIGIMFLLMR